MRRSTRFALVPLAPFTLLSLALGGCSGGLQEFPTAQVSGKVLCDGKPVANVIVNFAPAAKKGSKGISGKMGIGVTDADGAFTVSTYGKGDGAVVGKHSVSVSPPHPEDFPRFSCNCETVGNKQPLQDVEISADGDNEFVIELPLKPAGGESKTRIRPDELEDARKSAEES